MTELQCTVCTLFAPASDTLTVADRVVCGDCLYEARLPREGGTVGVVSDGIARVLTPDGVRAVPLDGGELL